MTNQANKWVKPRRKVLIKEFGGKCKHRGCKETRPSKLQFIHTRKTPLTASGVRGRKERMADINRHRKSYTLRCHRHHVKDFKAQHSRLIKKGIHGK